MTRSPAASAALPDGIEAVLFDLDNTLVDSVGTWRAAFAEVLEAEYASHPELRSLGPGAHVHDHMFRPLMLERHGELGGEWDDELVGYGFQRLLIDHASRDDALAALTSDAAAILGPAPDMPVSTVTPAGAPGSLEPPCDPPGAPVAD